jgi:hypothetical protein
MKPLNPLLLFLPLSLFFCCHPRRGSAFVFLALLSPAKNRQGFPEFRKIVVLKGRGFSRAINSTYFSCVFSR